jgi:hypothetical protein
MNYKLIITFVKFFLIVLDIHKLNHSSEMYATFEPMTLYKDGNENRATKFFKT